MNNLIKTMCEIIGEHQPQGGYEFPYSQRSVPILLNKDKTTTYPEIRISPFIQNADAFTERYREKTLRNYREWKDIVFQIDIFSPDLAEVNNIYSELRNRIYDFFNLEVLVYSYNQHFVSQGNDIYKNISYAVGDLFSEIYHIEVCDTPMQRVLSLEKLTDDSFYVDTEALYIKTSKNLKTIKISVITQGKLLNDKTSPSNRGIAYHSIGDPRNLSELEENEVERISFDIYVLYAIKRTRDKLPDVNKLSVKSKSSDFYGRKEKNNKD